jgi:hypothetical protein
MTGCWAPWTIHVARNQGSRLRSVSSSAKHHRAGGKGRDGLAEGGKHRFSLRVAFGDQPGPPPPGDLADPSVQGPQRHGWTTQPLPEPGNRPRLGFGQQPNDPLAEPGTAQAGPSWSRLVAQSIHAALVVAVDPAAHDDRVAGQQLGDRGRRPAAVRQQDHDQAGAETMRAVQQSDHVAGAARRAGTVSVHAGGRILVVASWGRLVYGRSKDPRAYFAPQHTLHPGLHAEPLVTHFLDGQPV